MLSYISHFVSVIILKDLTSKTAAEILGFSQGYEIDTVV